MPIAANPQAKAAFKDAVRRTARPPATAITQGPLAKRRPDNSQFVLAIDRIQPDRDQVRTLNKSATDQKVKELARSITTWGVKTALLVRYRRDKDIYELVAGERRYAAAKIVGLKELPVKLVEADDRTARQLQLHENIHRADLTPMEIAAALKRSLADGETPDSLAKMLCKSPAYVQKALTIGRQLSPAAQRLVNTHSQNFGSMDLLYEVAQSPTEEQEKLLRRVKDEGLTRSTLRQITAPLKQIAKAERGTTRGRKVESRSYTRSIPVDSGTIVTVAFRKTQATDHEVQRALQQALKSVTITAKTASVGG